MKEWDPSLNGHLFGICNEYIPVLKILRHPVVPSFLSLRGFVLLFIRSVHQKSPRGYSFLSNGIKDAVVHLTYSLDNSVDIIKTILILFINS